MKTLLGWEGVGGGGGLVDLVAVEPQLGRGEQLVLRDAAQVEEEAQGRGLAVVHHLHVLCKREQVRDVRALPQTVGSPLHFLTPTWLHSHKRILSEATENKKIHTFRASLSICEDYLGARSEPFSERLLKHELQGGW